MKKIAIIFLISLVSCKNIEKINKLKGKIISLQYDIFKLKNINNESFIIIDNNKYFHNSNLYKAENIDKLPSYNNIIMKIEKKEFKHKGSIISIAQKLFKLLNKTNKYEIITPKIIDVQGIITFKRKDNKEIVISYSENYPVKINVK
jgi:hypothetical protein